MNIMEGNNIFASIYNSDPARIPVMKNIENFRAGDVFKKFILMISIVAQLTYNLLPDNI